MNNKNLINNIIKKVLLLITHILDSIENYDNIILLKEGKVEKNILDNKKVSSLYI